MFERPPSARSSRSSRSDRSPSPIDAARRIAGASVEAAAASAVVERIDGPASASVLARRLSVPPPGNPAGVPLPDRGAARRHLASGSGDRHRHTGELYVAGGRRCRRARRGHHVRLRAGPGRDRDDRDREGGQHIARRRARRGRQGDAQRCRPTAHPVHEHVRPGADLDHVALPEPGPPAAHDPGPALHPGQQHRRPVRGRWRGSGVRPWWPGEGDREQVHGQPVRLDRARPRWRGAAGAQPVSGAAGDRRDEHVRWEPGRGQHLLERRRRSRASACRGRSSTACSPTTTRSAPAPTRPVQAQPGGGSGGAIYLDGNLFTLDLAGSIVRDNAANEGGGAIFFVSNDRTGELRISHSVLERNPSHGFETAGFPGIFFLGRGAPQVTDSTIS